MGERTAARQQDAEATDARASDRDARARELDGLLQAVAGHIHPDDRELVTDLTRAAYRRVAPEVLAELDPAVLAHRMQRLLALMDARTPGELSLRVRGADPEEGEEGSVVEVNVEDSPFLLSTVREELERLGVTMRDTVHPVVGVERDEGDGLTRILPAREAQTRESAIRVGLDDALDEDRQAEVWNALHTVLADTLAATGDYQAMRDAVREIAYTTRASAGGRYGLEAVDEACELLEWLLDDHFILLGYREYELRDDGGTPVVVANPATALGLLRDVRSSMFAEPVPLGQLDERFRRRFVEGPLLVVSRTNRPSTVHRQERMIYIGVKKVSGDGEIVGEQRLVGLFAQRAYAEPASQIPVLRRKLRRILEAEDIVDHSYDERALRGLFEAFPKHELFAADTEALRRTIVDLHEARRGAELGVQVRLDEDRRNVSVLVSLPRERFNAHVRQRIQGMLVDRFEAASVDYHLSITERDEALLHFVLHAGETPLGADQGTPAIVDELQHAVAALTRSWEDDLEAALLRAHGQEEGSRLANVVTGTLPRGYTDRTSPPEAVADIEQIALLARGGGEHGVRIMLQPPAGNGLLRFKLYKVGSGLELSSFLPILESLGFVVVEEVPTRLTGVETVGEVHLHDFGVRFRDDDVPVDAAQDGPRLAAAALAVWSGAAEVGSLNELVVRAGLGWEDIAVLRAYRRYRRQVGTSFTEAYLNEALLNHPDVARALVELFDARFDPKRDEYAGAASTGAAGRRDAVEAARAAVLEACEAVVRLDQDRILRGWLAMIDATTRTNRYRPDRDCLAFKLDSAAVHEMPKPTPFAEIFVYAADMEGVHLRGGPVARGGIRWSDRREDFRTEVLGLMKSQMVKNAVIVPTGAKGGFVLKRGVADEAGARRAYTRFVRGLLDVTDTVEDDEVVAHPWIRRGDGDDPYLVVAPDRGTAKFSDLANQIAESYDFWLGDAFASGGSRGYDHKRLGITARGAWVAVERHLRELDLDVSDEPIRVVGIGDMSGDVFGNGMLHTRRIKLVAAFDHRHVFIDPEPDLDASYAERKRLFETAGSTWDDYDRGVLSSGGGVWPRHVKSISLSKAAREVLRVDDVELAPPELIRAILRAPSDLLFAGGVGTFVKAAGETHDDVGDRANEGIRINGAELGARVVGEGANLALTQRGRIEYSRRGGRCNIDAADNAGGVDTSDREVNLKILLGSAIHHGELDRTERDEVFASMADDVAEQVLRDLYLHTWAISQELAASSAGLEAYETLMRDLEQVDVDADRAQAAVRLDRDVEALPDEAELARRAEAGGGLARPELAVLLGYAKAQLATQVTGSALPHDAAVTDAVAAAFPPAAVERFGHLLERHRLHRELVATVLANDLCNRMGITYANRTAHELGVTASEVVAGYWIARHVTDADTLWRSIEAVDGEIDSGLQLRLKREIDTLVDACARRYLRESAVEDVGAVIERDRPAFTELRKASGDLGSADRRAQREARIASYTDLGVDDRLARTIVGAAELSFAPEVAAAARDSGRDVRHVAEVFLRLTDLLPLDTLGRRLAELQPDGHWQRWQHRQLADELRDIRREAAAGVLGAYRDAQPRAAVESFLDDRRTGVRRVDRLVERLRHEAESGGLAAIAVVARALRVTVAR